MKATICDVGPGDGLQNEPEPLSAQVRAELVRLGVRSRRLPVRTVGDRKHRNRRPRVLLHGEGVETGNDLEGLIVVAAWLKETLGRELPGQVYRAGTFAPVAG